MYLCIIGCHLDNGKQSHHGAVERQVVKKQIDEIVDALIQSLSSRWTQVTKEEIENADGRRDGSNPICKKGSCLYVAYSGDQVLYVGETSKSIKRRFISDGSGSHKEACAGWYEMMSHVQFLAYDEQELPTMYRKFFEQALSIHHTPQYYGSRT